MRNQALLAIALGTLSCLSDQVAIRQPVFQQCQSRALSGCSEVADDVLLFVHGDTDAAAAKLRANAATNGRDKIHPFAEALRTLALTDDLRAHGSQFNAIATVLEGGTMPSEDPVAPAPRGDGRTMLSGSDVERALMAERTGTPMVAAMRTGTVVPGTHPDRAACAPFQQSRSAMCVGGFEGPLVVTDIDIGGSCPDEMLILAGGVEHPEWYLLNPPRTVLSIHAAQLVVRNSEGLVFAARRPAEAGGAVTAGPECYVTWSGRH